MKRRAIILVSLILTAAGAAPADSITLKLPYPEGIVITNVKDGSIYFRLANMKPMIGPLAELQEISISGIADLDAAEKLLKSRQYDQALAAYEQLLKKPAPDDKPWLGQLVSYRILTTAVRAKQIDRAVAAWLSLMDANEASAPIIALRPAVPTEKGDAVDRAIDLLAGKENQTSPAYRNAVDPYRMKLLQLQGRNAEAATLAEKISRSAQPDPGTPQSGRVAFVSKIEAAEQFLRSQQSDKVLSTLDPLMEQFNEAELVRALLATGQAQLALGKAAGEPQRQTLLCQATLSAMRVLMLGSAADDDKARALWVAGQASESFKDPNTAAAKKCYEKIIADYPRTVTSTAARQALTRLK
ncbi:MAG: hypothetical protein ABFD92_15500 [Planctomycetaceae bacterium]|nr:hypothetical protein [Planctomycetaceae bacterium]